MENLNVSIVDQQVQGLVESHRDFFSSYGDENKQKATAFVLLVVKCVLDCDFDQAADCLTDGGNDFAVDAISVGDPDDGEFDVIIFQGKYKCKDLSGAANFPAKGLQQVVSTVKVLFDPYVNVTLNEKLRPRIEEVRSRVRDGMFPNVRVVLCNNGLKWNEAGDEFIAQANFPKDQVDFIHFNHDGIVEVLKRTKSIDAVLDLHGAAIVEEFNFKRVLIGKLPVVAISDLFDKYDVQLLERNVRRYLGLRSNRVNSAISDTLRSDEKRDNFYFFNNGITVVCNKFTHNALQQGNFKVKVSGMQIINGGQTCKTIQLTLKEEPSLREKIGNVDVLLRLYELDSDSEDFVKDITFATNSQNPVELRDLHANDEIQKSLELGMSELGFVYRHKRDETQSGVGGKILQSSITAEAVLAIWRHRPHQSKFMRRELFGKLYDSIFNGLNAAQAIMANMIFRFVENERKRPIIVTDKDFLPYSGHYVAMRVGALLLRQISMSLSDINHRTFSAVYDAFENSKVALYKAAVNDVDSVLSDLYKNRAELSFQQLAATFRRGDVIESLLK